MKSAISLAILQESGKTEDWIERFKILVKCSPKHGAPSFIKVPDILSMPAAFAIFVFDKRSVMKIGSTVSRLRVDSMLNNRPLL